ncbi:mitochondrial import receptor subunit TOM6-like [Quillaja saponaria]|uniref:Mitochondrial import receptor subunit TOM6-like n=1 Tax=Quillaja saponaria TaxID=32244 RepID=A0AAD7KVR9_QUISA|nr:mitochondrial import receptor subunit TOM6-like [Quillaja saponaria]
MGLLLIHTSNLFRTNRGIVGTMFPGMFMRKPDKAVALKQLRTHVYMFGAWVAVIRITPYILHYLVGETEELKLEL